MRPNPSTDRAREVEGTGAAVSNECGRSQAWIPVPGRRGSTTAGALADFDGPTQLGLAERLTPILCLMTREIAETGEVEATGEMTLLADNF